MKKAVITPFCDVHYGQDNSLVPATHPDVPLRLNNQSAMLDLCEQCLSRLTEMLSGVIALGGKGSTRAGQDRRTNSYYMRLRAYCDARGIAYKGNDGNSHFPPELKQEFDQWEKTEGVASENAGDP